MVFVAQWLSPWLCPRSMRVRIPSSTLTESVQLDWTGAVANENRGTHL